MAECPFTISFAALPSKTGAPISAYDAVPIENLLVCYESGVFYPVYDALIVVESGPCKDPRTFFCPACGSRLRINAPPKSPVAECRKCAWATDTNRFKSLPDLLLNEKKPFAAQSLAFDSLVKTIQLGTDHEARASMTWKSEQSSAVTRSNAVSLSEESELRCRVDLKATEPVQYGGGYVLDFDCCASSIRESEVSEYEAAASDVTAAFSGRISMKDILPYNDRFSARNLSRASMPPRRSLGSSQYTMHSPFACKHPQHTESLRRAGVKASTVLPSFSVTRDANRLVLSARNVRSVPMHVDLELQHGHLPAGRSPEHFEVSWVGAHAANLPAVDGNHDFVLQVGDTGIVQLEIVVHMRLSHDKSKTERELVQEHLGRSNETWECVMVISQPRSVAGS